MKNTSRRRSEDERAPALPASHAFVVQFSSASQPSGKLYAGRVEHVVSGRAARFQSADEVLAFVARVLSDIDSKKGGA